MARGAFWFFHGIRTFGFIEPESGSKDPFVHATAMQQVGIPLINEGDKVDYGVKMDVRSGKSFARDLTKL